MKALILESAGRFVFHGDRPAPMEDPGADSLLVRVAACGICGSDLPRGFDPGGAYLYPWCWAMNSAPWWRKRGTGSGPVTVSPSSR